MTYTDETKRILEAVISGDCCPDCNAPNGDRHFGECPQHPEKLPPSKLLGRARAALSDYERAKACRVAVAPDRSYRLLAELVAALERRPLVPIVDDLASERIDGLRSENAELREKLGDTNIQWRDIAGYEGLYRVSNDGQVKSLDRVVDKGRHGRVLFPGRILKTSPNREGYHSVSLSRDKQKKTFHVHRLVAETFLSGSRFEGAWVLHNDGNRQHNSVANLRWGTPSANNLDSIEHGTHAKARKTHCPRNHAYNEDNTAVYMLNGRRQRGCRICRRANETARRITKASLRGEVATLQAEVECTQALRDERDELLCRVDELAEEIAELRRQLPDYEVGR